MKAQMTDIWFRNAKSCMASCAEEGVIRLTWTRQHLHRLKMDGLTYVRQFYMHTPLRPKIMLVGIQGTSEYGIFDRLDKPIAVYPTWSGKNDDVSELIDFIENPVGEDLSKCNDESIPPSLRPIYGQRHRVVIHNSPSAGSGVGQKYWAQIAQIQSDNPNVELFINGPMSFAVLFGLNFKACDFGLNDAGDTNQNIILPNGMNIRFNRNDLHKLLQWEDWIHQLGFTIEQLLDNKNDARSRLRIRSARWAAKHWNENYRFHVSGYNIAVDTEVSDSEFVAPQSRIVILRRKKFTTRAADKVLCNRCCIAPGCKVYRADSICGLRESEMSDLEKYFQSRNAGLIIDGLAEITKLQARRVDSSIDVEAASGEVDPSVTTQINALFANGVKLAKLVNPDLNGKGTAVQVNIGSPGSAEVVSMTNPKELMSGIVAMIEGMGFKREEITPSMIEGVLVGMSTATPQQAIEAQSIKAEDILGRQKEDDSSKIVEPVSVVSRDI